MDIRELTAPCGLDCFNCALYTAREDEGLRRAIAQRLGVSEDKAQCPGCRAEGGTISAVGMTQPCNVFRCITEKGLELCSDCDDFPCAHLEPRADHAGDRPHNTKVFNLARIRAVGLEQWASEVGGFRRRYFKEPLEL